MVRYFINVLWQLIVTNPAKIATLIAAIICFHFLDTFPNSKYKEPVITEYNDNSTWLYLIRNSGDESGYDVLTFSEKQKLVEGCLLIDDYSDLNILFWILFSISTLFFSISTIVGWISDDEDINWGLDFCLKKSVNKLIYCELEDNTYYYMAIGRLIGKTKTQINPRRVTDHFNIQSWNDIKKCPKFCTKTQNRNNLLNKLGI